MDKKLCYRHGDLCLVEVDKIPEGLKKSSSRVLMRGSNNNAHTYDNGDFYPVKEGQFVFGYFRAKDTTLFHKEHGKKIKGKQLRDAKIKDTTYQLRSQCEDTNEGMKPVVD